MPELRSGEGLAREVEGEGEGVRFGAGELGRGLTGPVGVRVRVSPEVGGTDSAGGGVLAETRPGIFGGERNECG